MRSTCFFLRVLLVGIALVLLPTTPDRSGLAASNLCASSTTECLSELGSVCDEGPEPLFDHFPGGS